MANLSTFRANTTLINDGEWVTVYPEDPFDIRTRGFTPRYRDALNSLRREAARKANRGLQPGQIPYSPDALPPTIDDRCQGEALATHCVLDIRGLSADGKPVSIDEFRDMLRDPEQFAALLMLAIAAAGRVHAERQDEGTEAGNG